MQNKINLQQLMRNILNVIKWKNNNEGTNLSVLKK
jgi:hypothetical protein